MLICKLIPSFVSGLAKYLPHRRSLLLSFSVPLLLLQCGSVATIPYKAYAGDIRPLSELALVKGDFFYRKDWLNSYVDAVRFQSVDGQAIENSRAWEQVLLTPGNRELEVYYSWDMGARIGLAPALVNYSSTRESISRVLHIEAEQGKVYSVKAEPVFNGDPSNINSLLYVDFWVEDSDGSIVLSREEGRFHPAP